MSKPEDSLNTTDLVFWVTELQQGRPQAAEPQFRKILAKVEPLVQSMFKKFPRVGRFVDVDDVIQNTIVRMLATFRQLRPASRQDFYKLVNALIRRELLDLTKKYYGPCGAGTRETILPEATETATQAEHELENIAAFHAELENLPVQQREVISLVYYHGWTQLQIADLFQVSVRTIQRWQDEGMQYLRGKLPGLAV